MADAPIEVKILGLVSTGDGVAIFLGNGEKAFNISVNNDIGSDIARILQGQKHARPTTHDLFGLIFKAFAVTVQRVLINDLRDNTYFARLTLKMSNEVQTRITEIDARPSDCIAIALLAGVKIHVAEKLWQTVADIAITPEELKTKVEQGDFDDLFDSAGDDDEEDDEK